MSDEETMTLIEQAARRWALERGAFWATQMAPTGAGQHPGLLRELADLGWLPESPDEWGDAPSVTLVRLGRIIAREAPVAFMPILAHWIGLQLLAPAIADAKLSVQAAIATSPYLDYSRTRTSVVAVPDARGWVLDGQAGWIVNAHSGCHLVLVATLPQGTTALFHLDCAQTGCSLGEPLGLLGLWGVPVRHVRLSSVRVGAENMIADGSRAAMLLRESYRSARWGVLSLVCGALERQCEHASAYAETRTQGGRKIIEHLPVRQLLDAAWDVIQCFVHLIEGFERNPKADYSTEPVRRQARLASDGALQVFGGIGYVCPGLPERCWRDVHQAITLCGGFRS